MKIKPTLIIRNNNLPKLQYEQKVSDSNFSCSFQEVKAYHFIFANTFFFAALEKQPLRFLDSQVTDDWLLKYNTFFVSSCGTTVKKCIAKRQKLADVCEHPLKLNCIKSSFFFLFSSCTTAENWTTSK